MSEKSFLDGYPTLRSISDAIDAFYKENYPDYFGDSAIHPVLRVKKSKVIHDNVWGTNRFSWRELALIDSPILQRLREIHQTGLAHHVYPCARHTRFEHSLGVTITASRIFDAIVQRNNSEIVEIAKKVSGEDVYIRQIRQELRLAALLHDVGHSLYSHTSERVYQNIGILRDASLELSKFVGKEKGAGEVLSFCIAMSDAVRTMLQRTQEAGLIGYDSIDSYEGPIDLNNVALIIVGRSNHPSIQFLGDIISSSFDADKLDYLLRDSSAAGLPLRYDFDRYLFSVKIEEDYVIDDEEELIKLYNRTGLSSISHDGTKNDDSLGEIPYFNCYRLKLPRHAMNTIEQIVMSKLSLFSYIYHHRKVRAAEGMLERMLNRLVENWKSEGLTDEQILRHFLMMNDSDIEILSRTSDDDVIKNQAYRIANRQIPREVCRLNAALGDSDNGDSEDGDSTDIGRLKTFLTDLNDKSKGIEIRNDIEYKIGQFICDYYSELNMSPEEMLIKANIWIDIPKAPSFTELSEVTVADELGANPDPLTRLFPIQHWLDAYMYYKHQIRIFCSSEYVDGTKEAIRVIMEKELGLNVGEIEANIMRSR